jgi:hypothetical protein
MARNIAQTPFPQLGHGAIQIGVNDSTTSQVPQEYTGVTAQIVLPRTAWMGSCKFRDEFQNINTVEAIEEIIAMPAPKPPVFLLTQVAQKSHVLFRRASGA